MVDFCVGSVREFALVSWVEQISCSRRRESVRAAVLLLSKASAMRLLSQPIDLLAEPIS